MQTIISNWLYNGEELAVKELHAFNMAARQEMEAKAQRFAEWISRENSRPIEAAPLKDAA